MNLHNHIKLLFTYTIIVILLGIAFTTKQAAAEEALEAKVLWQTFQNNQKAAEQTYFTKQIIISGIVKETGMSIYATPNVRLSDSKGGDIYAICVLPRTDAFKLSDYKLGEKVTFTGIVRHNNRGPVVLKNCQAVEKSDNLITEPEKHSS